MNTMSARLVYDNAVKALTTAFPGANVTRQFRMTQSFLRLEQAISTNKTIYQFPILVNETQLGIFNTEQRLKLQDSFVISTLGIYLAKPSSGVDATFELDTYPNTVKYASAAPLTALYNGTFNLSVNNDLLVPAWDLQKHFLRPQTQTTAATNSPLDQKRLAEDSLYPVEPNIVLIGSKNNLLQITLPAAISAADANSRIVVFMRGVLAQNSTVVS